MLSEEEVEEGGNVLLRDMELEEAFELVGAEGTAGRGLVCNAGPPNIELDDDDDIAAVLLRVEGCYS